MAIFVTIVFIVLAGLGVLLTLIPFAPSILYMVMVMTGYALIDGFNHVTLTNIIVFWIIFALSVIVDNFVGVAWARYKGASFASVMWGMIGTIIGFFVLPPFGAIFGMFIGVFLSEFYHKHNFNKAIKIAEASVVGQMIAVSINMALACILFGLFIGAIFFF